ncbi:MAG: DUF3604 domain-containing protein [Candidatus Heimdallarchaeota archaeon]|nr:DUF3604 domain-containing protein [Candidatus Heimdallarchaeota archaeon]
MTTYTPDFIRTKFGSVELLSPSQIVAGDYTELKFRVTIGEFGIDDGGHIKLAWPVTNSFGIPQFDDPKEENYTTIISSSDIVIKPKYEGNGYIRPFMPCITLKFMDGYLIDGDTVIITMGDQSQGSIGLRAQTYLEKGIECKLLFDPFGTNKYERLPDSPFLDIIPGPATELFGILGSEVTVKSSTWLLVRASDKWRNHATGYNGTVSVFLGDTEIKKIDFNKSVNGAIKLEDITFDETGIYRLKLTDEENGFSFLTNPIVVKNEIGEEKLFWGDLHGQTGETVGSGTMEEYFTFGRDVAAIDFISHAANAFQVTKAIWKKLQGVTIDFHEPGKFVTYLGYEWSGNPGAGGDHNVYYLNDNEPIHRCSHALIDDLSDLDTDRYPVSELYKEFEGRDDVMIIPHIGGRKGSLDVMDENLTPFIEIVSVHGHFHWFAQDAIDRDLKVGFIASSDTHSGRPGNSVPASYIEAVKSGLTAVYAKELTRESLWDAYKKRHVYATTGTRIILEFCCFDSIMGDEITINKKPVFDVNVVGTAGIEYVELYRGSELLHKHQTSNGELSENKICVRWTGARVKNRRRNNSWSGTISIENGSFTNIAEMAFDLPWEGITKSSSNSVSFISTTAGDYDGLVLEIEGNQNSRITFETEEYSTEFKLNDLSSPIITELGEVEKVFEVFKLPISPIPTHVKFSFGDENPNSKRTPYFVKIQQEDGEKAWSSPIFVNYF